MKKIIYLFLNFLFAANGFSQSSISDDFCLKLYSGKVIECDSFVKMYSAYIEIDEKKYNPNDVEFLKSSGGFYANVSKIKKGNPSYFMKAIDFGKINLYDQGYSYLNAIGASNWNFQSNGFVFYNKGLDPLKKANYNNLRIDLKDNPKAMRILNKNLTLSVVQYSIYAASVATLITGISMFKKDEDTATILIACSCPLYYIAYLTFPKAKNRTIKKAIMAYGMDN